MSVIDSIILVSMVIVPVMVRFWGLLDGLSSSRFVGGTTTPYSLTHLSHFLGMASSVLQLFLGAFLACQYIDSVNNRKGTRVDISRISSLPAW